ncbi:CPBP family intramembrane metalloprotease [Cohnella sp. CFH 77786]|uniref:type II CAAX endopeptidase family protein n=1 Tax=Cohnella sp. CFH 77786 TaxID=2662265 RepID=UPI001C60CF1E|nr:CPBP family intramembrane glutamic endopeptidase [Cohnella sp. CFH 77786]MBW5449439.1 CPBP family intramembrane metalloprotease [Cohnella sp. CFH 77786]
MKTKLLAAGGSLAYSAVYLFAFWLVTVLHESLLLRNFPAYRAYLERNIPVFLCLVFAIAFALFLIVSRAHTSLTKGRRPGILRTARFAALNRTQWAQIAVMGLGCTLLFLAVMNLSAVRNHTQDFARYVDTFGKADNFVYVLAGVGFLAVCFEEILFRGIVFNALNASMPVWLSLPLTSLIYGYFQPSFWISVTSFFLSVLYCLVYLRMKSLWASIGIGAVVNCLIMIADRTGWLNAMAQWPDLLLLAVAAAALLLIALTLVALWGGAAAAKKYGVMLGNLAVYVGIYYGLLQILVVIWEQAVLPRYPALREHGIIGLYANALLAMPLYHFVLKKFYRKDLIAIAQFRKVGAKAHVLNVILAVCMALWVMSLFSIPQVAKAAPGFEGIVGFFLAQNAWVFFSFFVLNSVYKEILFRALIFNELRRALPLPVSMVATGVFYGILFFSGDLPLMLYGTAGAVIFGLLYVWHRSIWLTIVNEYVLFAAYYIIRHSGGLPGGAALYAVMAASSVAILAILYGLWRISRPAAASVPEAGKVGVGA